MTGQVSNPSPARNMPSIERQQVGKACLWFGWIDSDWDESIRPQPWNSATLTLSITAAFLLTSCVRIRGRISPPAGLGCRTLDTIRRRLGAASLAVAASVRSLLGG